VAHIAETGFQVLLLLKMQKKTYAILVPNLLNNAELFNSKITVKTAMLL